MARLGNCINIVRKDGKRAVVPLSLWENSLKKDKDWKIEDRPILNTPEMKMVNVLISEKPVRPSPPPVVVPVGLPKVEVKPVVKPLAKEPETEKPKRKRKYTPRSRKPKAE